MFGQRRGKRKKCCCEKREGVRRLSDFAQGAEVCVVVNPDRRTLEMGVCACSSVEVVKNRPHDSNMVIDVGTSRYIIPKSIADNIRVR